MNVDFSLYVKNSWEWFTLKSQTKTAELWLGAYSFFETVVLPFPTDVFLALMVFANRGKVVRLVAVTTVSSILGVIVLYASVALFYSVLIEPFVVYFNLSHSIGQAREAVTDYVFISVFLGALTPIPFTPVIVAAGLLKADFLMVILASLAGRIIRYAAVAVIAAVFGLTMLPHIKKHMQTATLSVFVLIIFGALFLWSMSAT